MSTADRAFTIVRGKVKEVVVFKTEADAIEAQGGVRGWLVVKSAFGSKGGSVEDVIRTVGHDGVVYYRRADKLQPSDNPFGTMGYLGERSDCFFLKKAEALRAWRANVRTKITELRAENADAVKALRAELKKDRL